MFGKREKNNILKKIEKAQDLLNEADCALQMIENSIVYEGFDDTFDAHISSSGEGEIYITYDGHEINIYDVIDIMEEKGYIEPNDFYDKSRLK